MTAVIAFGLPVPGTAAAPASGFVDTPVLTGLTGPAAAAFAPDGRIFVAEQRGVIKVFDGPGDTSPATFLDIQSEVFNMQDRGMLGLALDPQFPARPYVYTFYTYDAPPGQVAPHWNDQCPDMTAGCPVQNRLSRLTAAGDTAVEVKHLLTGWCQQFTSHSAGSLVFGKDGALYVSAGEGAGYDFVDYGQRGNPCADPPGPQTPATAQGGALRAQSLRRAAGQPRALNGTVIRIDPDTGQGLPDNPFAGSADANERRTVAYGLRNPYRVTMRPGSDEMWIGDVGWQIWEEINRIPDVTDKVVENFGWPCYDGGQILPSVRDVQLGSCTAFYAQRGETSPYFAYHHYSDVVEGDGCQPGNSAVSGLAFENGSSYPAAYRKALFFTDVIRGCIWAMRTDASGKPDPARIEPVLTGLSMPVQLLTGPGGDLYYVSYANGTLNRVSHSAAPVKAVAKLASAPQAPAPGLVAAYGFEERDGSIARDRSGHGHDAVLSGGHRVTGGKYGRGLWFDGVDDIVTAYRDPAFGTPQFTVEAWTLPSSFRDRWQTAVSLEHPSGDGYRLSVSSPDKGAGAAVTVAGQENVLTTDNFLSVDNWTHTALAFDGKEMRLYLNGVLMDSSAVTGQPHAAGGSLRIGGRSDVDQYLHGILDEVRVYNRSLTQAEIAADMTQPIG
ncbi:MAG: LamG-like jellyroll fold domain-containing protein [Kibdelosporangium sp.]